MPTNMFHDWYMHSTKRKILIRCIKQSTLLLNMNRTVAKKANNHYESLGISPNATFNEIKSAYYKLTLQYHPDKNKSQLAKQKFHEISNAYDILSKYDSRKQYDKTLITKSKNTNFIKQKATLRSNVPYSQPKSIYDFDEWIKMHYSMAFMRAMENKQLKKDLENCKEKEYYERSNVAVTGIIVMTCLLIACIQILLNNKKIEKKNRKT